MFTNLPNSRLVVIRKNYSMLSYTEERCGSDAWRDCLEHMLDKAKGRYLLKGLQRLHLGQCRRLTETTPKMDDYHGFFRRV